MDKFDTLMKKKKEKSFDGFDFDDFEKEAISRLKSGEELTGKNGILTPLIKKILEKALDAELEQHIEEDDTPKRRNGRLKKKMKSGHGPFDLETSRDRNSTLEIDESCTTPGRLVWEGYHSVYGSGNVGNLDGLNDSVYTDVEFYFDGDSTMDAKSSIMCSIHMPVPAGHSAMETSSLTMQLAW